MATGHKVNNGVLSLAVPGDGRELKTLLEHFSEQGKSTGLVTTTYLTHATPAAFGAHTESRGNYSEIAADYLSRARPRVLFGGGANGLSEEEAVAAGYTVVQDRQALLALDTETTAPVAGLFGSTNLPYELDGLGDLPHLSEMALVAMDILENDPDGFFLVVEGGRFDHACHSNDLERAVHETVEFSETLRTLLEHLPQPRRTLIIVTADHETGGLSVVRNNGTGNMPTVTWSTGGHTPSEVPVYARGPYSSRFGGPMDNTDFYEAITEARGTFHDHP